MFMLLLIGVLNKCYLFTLPADLSHDDESFSEPLADQSNSDDDHLSNVRMKTKSTHGGSFPETPADQSESDDDHLPNVRMRTRSTHDGSFPETPTDQSDSDNDADNLSNVRTRPSMMRVHDEDGMYI